MLSKDVRIDVEKSHIEAGWGRGTHRETFDEHIDLPKGTY